MNKKTYRASLLLALGLLAVGKAQAAPVSILSLDSAYSQDFDTLSNLVSAASTPPLPTGWVLSESGGGSRDNERYSADNGGSNTGDTYSYGAAGSPERALGGLRSGTLGPTFGVEFLNATGATLTTLAIAFTGEQWRLGTAGRTDRLDFQVSTTATTLMASTYLDVDALDFVTPNTVTSGARNGNSTANSTAIGATITGLDIAANSSFWLRWIDVDASGADDGLAIDNFALTARGENFALSRPTALPEPASLALAGLALCGLLGVRRRR